MANEAQMSVTQSTQLVREGDLIAEVHVNLLEDETGWSPYLSVDDASKLDQVRNALRSGDLARASQLSEKIYRLTPVATSEK
jgi:hypothetical protein